MEQFVLKEKLKEIIGNRQVLAGLFYTFNFDPRFFENYVLPLFVGKRANDFSDEIIHNKILWRTCIKEGLVPPVTVYCDYYAKDNTEAPSLGYEIFCIKVKAAAGKICNFHPKQIFILLKDDTGYESLIVVTGSGNITPTGWCDNFESFSIQELKGDKTKPNKTTTNHLQDCISKMGRLAGQGYYTEAEDLIDNFLRYEEGGHKYFNSIHHSFFEFLEENITEDISELEIISPYFSQDELLINYLKKEKGIKKVKCLIPALKDNEIQLEKETFQKFKEAGIEWSRWAKFKITDKAYDRAGEPRNNHAKIYRFYSNTNTYTIIGSVNFTNPAWRRYKKIKNEANIESAWLYAESNANYRLLKPEADLNPTHYRFIEKNELENNEAAELLNRNAPEIEFVLDWKSKQLEMKAISIAGSCSFKSLFSGLSINKGALWFDLNHQDLKSLTKNTLIEIIHKYNGQESIHCYYPRQFNIEMKPLDFRLNTINILQFWEYLGDDYYKEVLSRSLAETITDESGIIHEDLVETKSLLNEMAAHYNGLIKLEEYLFPEHIQTKTDRRDKFKTIKHFLLAESIDTIPFYLDNLFNQQKGRVQSKSFLWMILQVVLTNIYYKGVKWPYKREIEKRDWKLFKNDLSNKIFELRNLATEISKDIKCPEKNLRWIEEQLMTSYE